MHSVTSNAVAAAIECTETSTSNTNWLIQKLGNGKYIATGWNKSSATYSNNANPVTFTIPSGYKIYRILNGNAFAEGNVENVTKAMHPNGNTDATMYVASGSYAAGYIRMQLILTQA